MQPLATMPRPENRFRALLNVSEFFFVKDMPLAHKPGSKTCFYRMQLEVDPGTIITTGCGIGCQFPDSIYRESMEGKTLRTLLDMDMGTVRGIKDWFSQVPMDDLLAIQTAHDNSINKDSLYGSLILLTSMWMIENPSQPETEYCYRVQEILNNYRRLRESTS